MQQDHAITMARVSAQRDSNTPGQWKLWGQRFTITWPVGNTHPTFRWFRPSPGDHPNGDSLQGQVMHYLGQYVLPYVAGGKLQCCTESVSSKGHKYRAHPSIYDGEPWHDHATLKWPNYNYPYPLPAFIHTFVDFPGTRIDNPEIGQDPINAGVYAVVHSFLAINKVQTQMESNTMIGR